MIESVITSKGRITLPKAVREALSVAPGDRVRCIIAGDEVRIMAARPIERLYGALAYDGPPATLEDMDRAVAEGAARA